MNNKTFIHRKAWEALIGANHFEVLPRPQKDGLTFSSRYHGWVERDDLFVLCPRSDELLPDFISMTTAISFGCIGRDDAGNLDYHIDFGGAIRLMKDGARVARKGWNGKGMWLTYVSAGAYDVGVKTMIGADDLLPWIGMKTADGKFVPWLASQTDILADDWCVLGGEA